MSNAPQSGEYEAVIVGSGPNGLAAGITLAREGLRVLVLEASPLIGGGTRTAELTLPGFHHDVCSAVHPMAAVSPFFRSLNLLKFGLEWAHPEILLAHPLENGRAAAVWRDIDRTAAALPGRDGAAWKNWLEPLLPKAAGLFGDLLGALPVTPRHPLLLARFGLDAMKPATWLARGKFKSEEARALIAGNCAHSVRPLEKPFTAAVGVALALAGHAGGWPVAAGGSASITRAMARYFEALGGEIVCGAEVRDIRDLPKARAVLFDTGPQAMGRIAASRLPEGYRRRLEKFRYGPGVFKLDLAVSEPIPWTNPLCRKAGTVHVGGTLEEIAEAERAAWQGRRAEKPFVLVGQQSLCDPRRAPAGKHTVWAYTHVTPGCPGDYSEEILGSIEHHAPGFRQTILASHAMGPAAIEAHNANNVRGDVIGGVMDLTQMFTRPVARWNPWTTPDRGIFICSSSTPPGGGVHGMCGHHAALTALRKVFGLRPGTLTTEA
ncbi:MAG: NAD(P)/FAD-dependent oxidoreductase [Verrucomicrobiota bacterium]